MKSFRMKSYKSFRFYGTKEIFCPPGEEILWGCIQRKIPVDLKRKEKSWLVLITVDFNKC